MSKTAKKRVPLKLAQRVLKLLEHADSDKDVRIYGDPGFQGEYRYGLEIRGSGERLSVPLTQSNLVKLMRIGATAIDSEHADPYWLRVALHKAIRK